MVESGITRAPSAEEKKEYRQLGAKTPKDIFLKELADVEAKFTKEHLPFDSQCARLDFQDRIEDLERESERKYGYVRVEDVNKVIFGDLSRYGDLNRFEVVADDEEIEMQNINNIRSAVKIGHTLKYKCKARGHGVSVFLPENIYNERMKGGKK